MFPSSSRHIVRAPLTVHPPIPSLLRLPTARLGGWTTLVALALVVVPSCGSLTSSDEPTGFSGEWCTYRSIGSDGLPLPAIPFVGMTLLREGDRVLGTGTTKRAGDTIIWPSRYRGDIEGIHLVVEVSDLPGGGQEEVGPHFTLELQAEGSRDLVGTAFGDEGFDGPIRMVRVSARCFGN